MVTVTVCPSGPYIFVVSISGYPRFATPVRLYLYVSRQPPVGIRFGACGGLSDEQFKPYSRLMYQPSLSIFILLALQASGDDSAIIVCRRCRAVNPNISLRSPVSTVLMLIVTTPPRREGSALAGGPLGAVAVSLSPDSIGVMKYLRARSLI